MDTTSSPQVRKLKEIKAENEIGCLSNEVAAITFNNMI